MSFVQNNSGVYIIISNIPKSFRSNLLRYFFSSFIESSGFICFHYIHRPEVEEPLNSTDNKKRNKSFSSCCIAKVVAHRVHQLIETYNGQHWFDYNGEYLPTCCFIKIIKLSNNGISIHGGYKWAIPKNLPIDQEEFSVQEVDSLREMRPPSFMPNGNVGTTTDYLLNEIRQCKLPQYMIRKYGLQFPGSQSRGINSSVAFDFMSKKDGWKSKRKLDNFTINSKPFLRPSFHSRYWHSQFPGEISYWEDEDHIEIPYPKEEKLDQYQALQHVYGQGRLFEEKIGSGSKDGSSLAYNPHPRVGAQSWNGVDNNDTKDYPKIKLEKEHKEAEVDKKYEFAGFEKYNKGVGSKILKALGWKEGQGIGKNGDGIAEPLPNEGQGHKKGFGYQCVKLEKPSRQKRRHRHLDDPKESVVASPNEKLKYQKEFLKGTM